ncbi:MAG: XRE family transcriptional regulator [Vibrio sp.]
MEYTQEDRDALYNLWMSQKAKRRLTQMEMAKRLEMSISDFANVMRGKTELSNAFVNRFFQQLDIEPQTVLPSLKYRMMPENAVVYLQNRVVIDGDIQNVQIDGNQVIINYCCHVSNQ